MYKMIVKKQTGDYIFFQNKQKSILPESRNNNILIWIS